MSALQNVHPSLVLIGLIFCMLVTAALCAVSYQIGWKEGRRRWLRDRTQREIDMTEELRKRELRRSRV